jgi:hypothetical protein
MTDQYRFSGRVGFSYDIFMSTSKEYKYFVVLDQGQWCKVKVIYSDLI